MGFLTIIADNETFDYSPIDPATKQRTETVFVCRIVAEDRIKELRKQHTKRSFEHHQPVERFDEYEFGMSVVDEAIVSWRGLRDERTGQELPCTPAVKRFLPAEVQAEVIRMCGAKEAGSTIAKTEEEKKLSAPISSGKSTSSPD